VTIADAVFAKTQSVFSTLTPAVGVYDSTIPGKPTSRYVVLYLSPDARRHASVSGGYSERRAGFQVRFVAPTRRECVGLVDRFNDQMLGWTPTVAGMFCGPVQPEDPDSEAPDDPVSPDESVADRVIVETNLRYLVLAYAG
jgi:hypothetical protein